MLSMLLMTGVGYAKSKIQEEILPNGLTLVAVESHKVPLVTIVLSVKAGAFTETPETNGLTHLWEHMFFKGNASLPDQEAFQKRIQDLGIIYNGDTHPELVRYYFTLPSVFLEEGLEFMYQAIANPLIDQKELEREIRVVLDEYDRNASQPNFELLRERQNYIYGAQSYLRNPLGKRETIANATREKLLRIKDEVFVPQNSSLLVSGDFDSKLLSQKVQKVFERWKNPKDWKKIAPPQFPKFPSESKTLIFSHPHARNVGLSITYEGPKARISPKQAYIADILSGLLGHRLSGFSRRYIDTGLIFGGGFSYYTQSQAGELTLSISTTLENYKKISDELLREPSRWLEEKELTQEQLEDVRSNLLVGKLFEENKASEYIKNLGFWWAVTDLPFYDHYVEEMSKVTLDDVREFIKVYLIEKPTVTAVLLSPEDAKKIGAK